MKEKTKTRFFLFAIGLFVLGSCFSSVTVNAATLGDIKKFYVDSSYDISGRSEVSATLERISNQLYFYVDDSWWGKLFLEDKNKIDLSLFILADEFEKKIYPMLTSAFGSEWKPGIDNDAKITILIHPMKKNSGGYFNTGNEYSKLENPNSNEREMFYLNSDYITYSLAKSFLAHEFVHLITFNQKDIIQNIEEDVWLNEARADYAPTLLGYDNVYQGSNLQRRVNEFLRNPSNSIVDWQGAYADYGALNLFTQYLVDNYGIKILVDSLNSPKKGIESINYALAKNNHSEDFSQVFTNWTIAVSVNNCSFGQKYCYKNENLKNLKVTPADNLLPVDSQSNLISNTRTKDWAGHWQRIFGGGGTLTFSFEGSINSVFKVPYVLCDNTNICSINFIDLDKNQMGKIIVKDFNSKYFSLTVIPSAQGNNNSSNISFFWQLKTNFGPGEDELISQLLNKIAELKAEIARLQSQLDAILGKSATPCKEIQNDLFFGMVGSNEVSCLQEFLKNQGQEIYPEGLITGNFLSLTKSAVVRFQEKYKDEILKPLGLERGTGYVGAKTRAKINQLLK